MEELLTPAIDLQLPSDKRLEELEARVKLLETRNEGLQRRLTDTLNDWRAAQNTLRANEVSDILCDFIAEFYHNELLVYLQKRKVAVKSWNDISMALSDEARNGQHALKETCMRSADFTEDEWDSLYEFKKTRNVRVHPRRNKRIIARVMRELPSGLLRTALDKMFNRMMTTGTGRG